MVDLEVGVVNQRMAQTRNIWIFACVLCALTVTGSTGKPNIIIMLMDDVGECLHDNYGNNFQKPSLITSRFTKQFPH